MKMLTVATATVGVVLLAVTGTASAGRDLGEKFDSASARGDFAVAVASGTVDDPKKILARVTSSPHQQVKGSYSVTCAKGTGAGTKSGSVNGNAPLTKKLPLPMSKPDFCSVGVSAQLDDDGKVTVTLYAK